MSRKTKEEIVGRLFSEMKNYLLIASYLWIVLSLLEIHKLIVLRQYSPDQDFAFKLGFNLFNALVLGKIIFFAETLRLGERFRHKPLIHAVLYKSALFAALLVAFDIVEDILTGLFHGKTVFQSAPKLGGGGLDGILLVGVLVFFLLIPFFLYREISRVLGKDQLNELLFRGREGNKALPIERDKKVGI